MNLVSNDEGLLSVSVPPQIKARIAAVQKRSPVGALDLKFIIKVKNDTGKDFPFSAIAVFIDQGPQVFSTLTSKAGGAFVATLSDVSAKAAVENGLAMVLLHKSQ